MHFCVLLPFVHTQEHRKGQQRSSGRDDTERPVCHAGLYYSAASLQHYSEWQDKFTQLPTPASKSLQDNANGWGVKEKLPMNPACNVKYWLTRVYRCFTAQVASLGLFCEVELCRWGLFAYVNLTACKESRFIFYVFAQFSHYLWVFLINNHLIVCPSVFASFTLYEVGTLYHKGCDMMDSLYWLVTQMCVCGEQYLVLHKSRVK